MQQSAQRNSAKAIRVGFPGFRKLEDLLGNKVRDGIDLVLELKRLARHPMGRAHGFHDLRLKTVYQAARTPKVTHLHTPHVACRSYLSLASIWLRIRHTFRSARAALRQRSTVLGATGSRQWSRWEQC